MRVWQGSAGDRGPYAEQVAAPNLGRVLLRPTRAVEELNQVAATRTERRQIVKVGS